MKVRYLGILLLAFLTLFSCDDNTGTLGMMVLKRKLQLLM